MINHIGDFNCSFVFLLTVSWFAFQPSAEVCKFPHFLRRPTTVGWQHRRQQHQQQQQHADDSVDSQHQWTTEIRYSAVSGTPGSSAVPASTVQSQLDILVREREIIATVRFKVDCPSVVVAPPAPKPTETTSGDSWQNQRHSTVTGCYQTEVVYRRACLSADTANNKYKVVHTEGLTTYTTCIKFVQRNLNVVQIFQGSKESNNPEDVCSDHLLHRQEWPWIATVQEEWSFCPLIGGFDFRAFANKNREKLCPGEWRPSRLEAECVQGDGLLFTFPRHECSPLADWQTDVQLQCWASWTEDGYWFIVASFAAARQPQYVLRFPARLDEVVVRAYWYMSPVTPTGKRGLPSGHNGGNSPVEFVELLMNKSEPGLCYDDSSQCVEYARDGRCTNSALYQYANYCKRSCGLCNLLPSPRPECRFPIEYHGDWIYVETDRSENVSITADHIAFSSLGEFVCKSKHWNINYYKLFSVYVNGCRPRYTCLHLERDSGDRVRFQLSASSTTDQSFELCVFKDDPAPLASRIHSTGLKTLVPFTCTSYAKLEPDLSLLVTKSEAVGGQQADTFLCWVIKTFPERHSYAPWREVYVLPASHCSNPHEFDDAGLSANALFALTTESDSVEKPCGQVWTPTDPPSLDGDDYFNQLVDPSSSNNKQVIDHDTNFENSVSKGKYVANSGVARRSTAAARRLTLWTLLSFRLLIVI